MRLATYNLESLDFERRNSLGAQRFAPLRRHLIQLSADILCLQEVNAQHSSGAHHADSRRLLALDELLRGTTYADYHRAASLSTDGKGYADVHNLVVLSRWPIRAQSQIHHDIVPAPAYRTAASPCQSLEVRWDRPILTVDIDGPGGAVIHIINLHLRAPLAASVGKAKGGQSSWTDAGAWAEGYYLAAMKRSGQALEARLLVERLLDEDPEALIAVCGDCNAELTEVPLRILAAGPEDVGNPDLARRRLVAVEGFLAEDHRYSLLHGGRRVMFDHILVSEALRARFRHAEIHNTDLSDECLTATPRSGSFHAPMVGVFDDP